MSLRLAFNCRRWIPTKEQFLTALSMIQCDERNRVCGFVFQKDVKTALIGRLMIRKAIMKCMNMKNKDIVLGRTDHGRPFLETGDQTLNFDFNISHQDDMVVLACEMYKKVGIDVVCIERPVGSLSTERFFELMRRQLSTNEWDWINSNGKNEKERLTNFYRIWCMKESYVKAIGIGIGYSISRLDCNMADDFTLPHRSKQGAKQDDQEVHIHNKIQTNPDSEDNKPLGMNAAAAADDDAMAVQPVIRSSFLRVDERLVGDWSFEETLLMGRYLACVAVKDQMEIQEPKAPQSIVFPSFHFLTIDELLEDAVSSDDDDDDVVSGDDDDVSEFPARSCFDENLEDWELFTKKEERPKKKLSDCRTPLS